MPHLNPNDGLAYRQAYRDKNKRRVVDYLATHPCVRCGFSDPRALDFDHLNPAQKNRKVSAMVSGTPKWESLLEEIEKCQVLCANCHRIKTVEQKDYVNSQNCSRSIAARTNKRRGKVKE